MNSFTRISSLLFLAVVQSSLEASVLPPSHRWLCLDSLVFTSSLQKHQMLSLASFFIASSSSDTVTLRNLLPYFLCLNYHHRHPGKALLLCPEKTYCIAQLVCVAAAPLLGSAEWKSKMSSWKACFLFLLHFPPVFVEVSFMPPLQSAVFISLLWSWWRQ